MSAVLSGWVLRFHLHFHTLDFSRTAELNCNGDLSFPEYLTTVLDPSSLANLSPHGGGDVQVELVTAAEYRHRSLLLNSYAVDGLLDSIGQ